MSLEKIAEELKSKTELLSGKWTELSNEEVAKELLQLNDIAHLAIQEIYNVAGNRTDCFQNFYRQFTSLPLIYGHEPSVEGAAEYVFNLSQVGGDLPLDYSKGNKAGKIIRSVIRRLYITIVHLRIWANGGLGLESSNPSRTKLFEALSEETRGKIAKLEEISKENASDWAECMADLFFDYSEEENEIIEPFRSAILQPIIEGTAGDEFRESLDDKNLALTEKKVEAPARYKKQRMNEGRSALQAALDVNQKSPEELYGPEELGEFANMERDIKDYESSQPPIKNELKKKFGKRLKSMINDGSL
ncbi:MAG: hypothetical protein P8L44_16880 [Opitutales bacterium]|nr:hypothetical protein [Opitutales bacterium]